MRSSARLAAAFAAICTSLFASSAIADLPPPPGYVETCTVAKQQKAGDECHECRAYHGNADHCSDSLKEYAFSQRCRARGASTWAEVWCRGSSPTAKKVPPEILGQLGNATSVVRPPAAASGAPSAAPPASAPPVAPVPEATAPVAPPANAQVDPPPPVPPTGGCGGCATPPSSPADLAAPAIAIAAAALAWRRRRTRREGARS